MSTVARGLRLAAACVLAGGVVITATVVGGSVELAAPQEQAVLPTSADVLVDEASLVCPGQQRSGAAGLRKVEGTVTVAAATPPAPALAPRTPSGGGGALVVGPIAGKQLARVDARAALATAPVRGADAVLVHASGGLAPGLVGAQTWVRSGDDDRGLAVTPCSQPAADLWFVGGGGSAGRTERLILINPGANAITVGFEVLGAAGPVESARGRTESIPPRSRAVVSLDALAPGEASPVVHVTATGGLVSGVLNDAWMEGATGHGLDDAVATRAPASELLVPGVQVDGPTTLRLGNPGEREALARVRILGPDGDEQPPQLRAVRVPPGSTTDVSIRTARTGVHALQIRSDSAVVAGVQLDRVATGDTDPMGDFGWAPATAPIRGVAGATLPGLPARATRQLLLASVAGGAVSVTTATGSGAAEATRTSRLTVDAQRTAWLDLGDADRVWVTQQSGDVHAAVAVAAADRNGPLYSVVALTSAPVAALSVPVRQLRD